jgi:hypothetical protein
MGKDWCDAGRAKGGKKGEFTKARPSFYFYNRRQLRKRQHPRYPAYIIDPLPIRV